MLQEIADFEELIEHKRAVFKALKDQSTDLSKYHDKNQFMRFLTNAFESINTQLEIIKNLKSANKSEDLKRFSAKRIVHFLTELLEKKLSALEIRNNFPLEDKDNFKEITKTLNDARNAIESRNVVELQKARRSLGRRFPSFIEREYGMYFKIINKWLKDLESFLNEQIRILRKVVHPMVISENDRTNKEKARRELKENEEIFVKLENESAEEEKTLRELNKQREWVYKKIEIINDLFVGTTLEVKA